MTGIEMYGAQPSGFPACCAHSESSRKFWIASAPFTVSTTSGWPLNGMFSLKLMPLTGVAL